MILDAEHGALMDRVYRHQRHFYDVTRKLYLAGRDELISQLQPPIGGRVLEIGCGTGRNLFAAAERYPGARFYGIDISLEMLATALERAGRNPSGPAIRFAHADAAHFDPQETFGMPDFDRVFISYALSMIPHWREALRRAMAAVAPGGSLHIVDFGQQEHLPAIVRTALLDWLAWFHVKPRASLLRECERVSSELGGELRFRRLHRGYAWSLRLTMPANSAADRAGTASAGAGTASLD
jgi:S-adenosylmethionine-diacylgycerolhomoserine-N-methlytransferase